MRCIRTFGAIVLFATVASAGKKEDRWEEQLRREMGMESEAPKDTKTKQRSETRSEGSSRKQQSDSPKDEAEKIQQSGSGGVEGKRSDFIGKMADWIGDTFGQEEKHKMMHNLKGHSDNQFKVLDKNEDGSITLDEVKESPPSTPNGKIVKPTVFFAELDENEDGKIDIHEFRKHPEAMERIERGSTRHSIEGSPYEDRRIPDKDL